MDMEVLTLNYDFLRTCDEETREKLMRKELGAEKCRVIDKYGLKFNSNLYWEKREPKYPTQEYFSYKLALKSTVIGMIFHIHRLCFAKVKYFENNWHDYEPCKYVWTERDFVRCELYDMEAIRQKATGIVVDLRDLARIKWLKDFHAMCAYLEEKKREANIA